MNKIHKLIHYTRPAFVGEFISKVLRIKRQTVQTDFGIFKVDPVSHFALNLTSKDGYESEMRSILDYELKAGMNFLDVGGNEGFFTILGARLVGEHGHVFTIEPQSRMQIAIHENLVLNNNLENVSLFKCCLSDFNGIVEISLSPSTNTGASGLTNKFPYPCPKESVPVMTLEAFFKAYQLPQIDVMKMDIEGYELEVLMGAKELLKSGRIHCIVLELHNQLIHNRGKNPDHALDVLAECGYEISEKKGFHVARFKQASASS